MNIDAALMLLLFAITLHMRAFNTIPLRYAAVMLSLTTTPGAATLIFMLRRYALLFSAVDAACFAAPCLLPLLIAETPLYTSAMPLYYG